VARALADKKNPIMEQLVQDAYSAGRDAGYRSGKSEVLLARQRAMLHAILAQRGIALDDASRARIDICDDADTLQTWATRALQATSLADLLRDL
jgi:hypothetical protein